METPADSENVEGANVWQTLCTGSVKLSKAAYVLENPQGIQDFAKE